MSDMSNTPKSVNSTVNSTTNIRTEVEPAIKEGKYGRHKVSVNIDDSNNRQTSTSQDSLSSSSTLVKKLVNQVNNIETQPYSDVYTSTLTTLALFADTLMAAGLNNEVAVILTALGDIIKAHEKAEERKAETERQEIQEDKRINEQYLQHKLIIEKLHERLLSKRSELDLKDKETQFDDYLKRLETEWIKK